MQLILASASPRRADLLAAAGFSFDRLVVSVDERARAGEPPGDYVRRLAREKSAQAMHLLVGRGVHASDAVQPVRDLIVLGADTAVALDGQILGKPRDDGEAASMLRQLSGRTHDVLTGISLRRRERELSHVETTAVTFAPMSADEIAWYVASGEGRDKAGGYGVQGVAARFVVRLEGSHSNVVGLPLAAVYRLIRSMI